VRQYQSYDFLREERRRHRRRKKSPIDVFKVPLTAAQQVGWHEEVVINKRYPKKSCEETRYQDAVVKARWF